ncbi:MAG TPA: hypothetical protein EYP55_05035 [Anaerolineae bacterium]|nr:hypothetical protein [Anaerolineae bacterium]
MANLDLAEEVAQKIIAELKEKFPDAEYLINTKVYGEEDLYIDIYIDEKDLLTLDRLANEITFRYWEKTGYNILPMVAPLESCPIKR